MPIVKRVPDFVDGKTFIIESVLVDHASVFAPNTNYRPEWCVVIRVPQTMVQQFYEVGFRLKQTPDGIINLRCRRWVRLDDGTEMRPPEVVDADGNPWDVGKRGLIGNGSRCNVKVRAKYTTYQGVEGLSCYLEGLQVCDLIPYAGTGPSFGKADGNTGGWSQQNFTPPPAQMPVNPAFGQPTPGGFAPPQQNPAQQNFQNPYVPQHMAPTPAAVAPAPQPGFFTPPTAAPQPHQGQPQEQDYVPPGYSGTGSDVPF